VIGAIGGNNNIKTERRLSYIYGMWLLVYSLLDAFLLEQRSLQNVSWLAVNHFQLT
jgi:hypothetical protein